MTNHDPSLLPNTLVRLITTLIGLAHKRTIKDIFFRYSIYSREWQVGIAYNSDKNHVSERINHPDLIEALSQIIETAKTVQGEEIKHRTKESNIDTLRSLGL